MLKFNKSFHGTCPKESVTYNDSFFFFSIEAWGVKAWIKEPIAPRFKSFPRIAFFTWQFFIGLYYIFHIVF